MPRRPDGGRRRRLNERGWLLNIRDRLGGGGGRGAAGGGEGCASAGGAAGVVGQVPVSVGRDAPATAGTVATPGEAMPGSPATVLGAGMVRRTHSKERKQAEQDCPPHGRGWSQPVPRTFAVQERFLRQGWDSERPSQNFSGKGIVHRRRPLPPIRKK